MKTRTSIFLAGIILTVAMLFITGCSSGSISNSGVDQGSYVLSIAWPEQDNQTEQAKVIPAGSTTVYISITGENLDSALTSSIDSSQTSVTLELPIGNKIALIKALDSSGNITAQRKESFIINAGQTVTSDHIPLGVAVTGTTSVPVFEPTSINVPYGTQVYFQNWLAASYTCRVKVNNANNDANLASTYTDGYGKTVFPDIKSAAINGYCPLSLVGFSATAKAQSKTDNYQYSTQWSGMGQSFQIALDPDNNVYVCGINDNKIYKYNSSGTPITNWASQLVNSSGITYSPSGILYVTGVSSATIKKFSLTGGDLGTINAGLSLPMAIAADQSGYLYVTENTNSRVRVFDSAGNSIRNFSTGNSSVPHGIAIDSSGYVYAACMYNHSVKKFDSLGNLQKTISGWGSTDGTIDCPVSVAVDYAGNVYIGDRDDGSGTTYGTNCKLQKFNSNGEFIKVLAVCGTGNGQIHSADGIALDPAGNLYFTDRWNLRVQKILAIP